MITHKFGLDYSISFKKVDPDDSEILKEFECEEPAIRLRRKGESGQN